MSVQDETGEMTMTRSRRERSRDSLLLMANVRVEGSAEEPLSVRIRNLSEGGLMAEFPEPVDPDARVHVEVRGIGWVPGRIAWQAEGRAGIAFDREIDPQRARKPIGGNVQGAGYPRIAAARG